MNCEQYDIRLNDGTLYRIICTSEDLDKLIALIGEANICQVE